MSSCTRYNVCKSNTESSYVRRRILVVICCLLFSAYGPSTKLVISFDIAYLWAYSFAVMFMILNFDRMHLALLPIYQSVFGKEAGKSLAKSGPLD